MGASAAEILTRPAIDVAVIGGGPAGLVAASDLAQQGYTVRVLEEHHAIGSPVHCTGVVGVDAFSELALPTDSIRAVVRQARFHGPAGRPLEIETEHIAAAVIDRSAFDESLAHSATRAGASLATGAHVERIAVAGEGVRVHVRGAAPTLARACVLACGANYRFNRALGLGLPGTLVQSAQCEIPFRPAQQIHVFLGQTFAPGGFAWLVPFERDGEWRARVGLFCIDDASGRFATFAGRIAREWHVDIGSAQPRLKALPLAPVSKTFSDRLVAVGDAAGLVKPTTGGGIYYSILSGRLAAQTLAVALSKDTLDARSLAPYERAWKARLGRDLRSGLAFRRVAARLGDDTITRLLDLARVDGIVPLLKKHGDFNWHRAAAVALLRHVPFRRTVGTFWG